MARQMMDIGLDDSYDLQTGGDFGVAESTVVHQKGLILDNKGEYKENPILCIGAFNYTDSERPQELLNEMSKQFAGDGMDVQRVAIAGNGSIQVAAFYK